MNPQFEFPGGALALLRGKRHVLADVPLVRRCKAAGLVHGPIHAPRLAIDVNSTTPKSCQHPLATRPPMRRWISVFR